MIREELGASVLMHKATGSKERADGWEIVAETLNSIEGLQVIG